MTNNAHGAPTLPRSWNMTTFRAVVLGGLDTLALFVLLDLGSAYRVHSHASVLSIGTGLLVPLLLAHLPRHWGGLWRFLGTLSRALLATMILVVGFSLLTFPPIHRSLLSTASLVIFTAAALLSQPTMRGARSLLVLLGTLVPVQIAELGLAALASFGRAASDPDWGRLLSPYFDVRRGGRLIPGFDGLAQGPHSFERVRWLTNADGFRNSREFGPEPPSSTTRIVLLGDSLSAGYRMTQADIWPEIAARSLNREVAPEAVEIANAVIDDPAGAWYYYQRFGSSLGRHHVVLSICIGNDFSQAYTALAVGGLLRYSARDGHSIERNPSPDKARMYHGELARLLLPEEARAGAASGWMRTRVLQTMLASTHLGQLLVPFWERLGFAPPGVPIGCWYEHSEDAPRAMDPVHALGFFLMRPPAQVEESFALVHMALANLKALCDERGARLALIICPQRFQVHPADWDATVARYNLAVGAFDLMRPNGFIRRWAGELAVPCLDLTEPLHRRAAQERACYYLPGGDMHWNAAGHRAVAVVASPFLRELVGK
ncbi:MAG: hypothetical protein U1E76_14490 [Planctomycetota bacterium]